MNELGLDEVIIAWAKAQHVRHIFKARKPPQSLQDALILAHGALPPTRMLAAALKRCGFTRYNGSSRPRSFNCYHWLSPHNPDQAELLMSFRALTCPACGTASQRNRPDGYRFACIDCGHAESSEESLARLRQCRDA